MGGSFIGILIPTLCWTWKAALGDSPVDCRNRRGFSAEKQVQQGEPRPPNRVVFFCFLDPNSLVDGMLIYRSGLSLAESLHGAMLKEYRVYDIIYSDNLNLSEWFMNEHNL